MASATGILLLLQSYTSTHSIISNMSYTINGLTAQQFNIVSDLLAKASRLILVLVFSRFLYQRLLKWHLQAGGTVPVQSLGQVPEDVVTGAEQVWFWRGTVPAVILGLLMVIGDFSHTVADSGLDFETSLQEGGNAFVLDLFQRNTDIIFQAMGDHGLSERTKVFLDNTADFFKLDKIPLALMGASDSIAMGQSSLAFSAFSAIQNANTNSDPQAQTEEDYQRSTTYQGLDGVMVHTGTDANEGLLASMNGQIPLNCTGMESIFQLQGLNPEFDVHNTTARVPNCNFVALRESGIYKDSQDEEERIEVSAYLLLERGRTSVQVTKDNTLLDSTAIAVAQDERVLARDQGNGDKDAWKQGRVVDFIDGVSMGIPGSSQAMYVPLQHAVLANTGVANRVERSDAGPGLRLRAEIRMDYVIAASVARQDCPPHSNNRNNGFDECMAYVHLMCDPFVEDFVNLPPIAVNNIPGFNPELAYCSLFSVEFVWLKGVAVDPLLVSLVAGVYGRNYPSAKRQGGFATGIARNAIPAAMVMQSSLSMVPQNEQVVRATVNGTYIVFMILPVIVAVLAFAVCFLFNILPGRTSNQDAAAMPTDGWHLLLIGAEHSTKLQAEKRSNSREPFKEPSEDLVYAQIGQEFRLVNRLDVADIRKEYKNSNDATAGHAVGSSSSSDGGNAGVITNIDPDDDVDYKPTSTGVTANDQKTSAGVTQLQNMDV